MDVQVFLVNLKFNFTWTKGGPHTGVPNRNRCGNRDLGSNGGRTRWVHLGDTVGVSEVSWDHVPSGKCRNTHRTGRFETQLRGNVKDGRG